MSVEIEVVSVSRISGDFDGYKASDRELFEDTHFIVELVLPMRYAKFFALGHHSLRMFKSAVRSLVKADEE